MNRRFVLLILYSCFYLSLQQAIHRQQKKTEVKRQKTNDINDDCHTCTTLTSKFITELRRTKKGNFGGGNSGNLRDEFLKHFRNF